MASEDKFPTVRDVRDQLSALIERGFGDLPCLILVVPDSTLQAIARASGNQPSCGALMIEFDAKNGRLPVSLISADRLQGANTSSSVN